MVKKILYAIFFFSFCALSACSSDKKMDYNSVSLKISKETLVEELGQEPSSVTKQDNADEYIYEQCEYLGYTGTMTYIFALDELVVSRWESITDQKENMSEMYETIKKELDSTYGEGAESADTQEDTTCIWKTSDKTISIGTSMKGSQYMVYIIESKA